MAFKGFWQSSLSILLLSIDYLAPLCLLSRAWVFIQRVNIKRYFRGDFNTVECEQ